VLLAVRAGLPKVVDQSWSTTFVYTDYLDLILD
jgi:hypothetical protein